MTVARPVEAVARISPGKLIGGIFQIDIDNRGDGYTQFNGPTALNISLPTTSGWDEDNDGIVDYPSVPATATANFVDGKIAGVTITNPGFGYVSPPTITIPVPQKKATTEPSYLIPYKQKLQHVSAEYWRVCRSTMVGTITILRTKLFLILIWKTVTLATWTLLILYHQQKLFSRLKTVGVNSRYIRSLSSGW